MQRSLSAIIIFASVVPVPAALARSNETLQQAVHARRMMRLQRTATVHTPEKRLTVTPSSRRALRKLSRERRIVRPKRATFPPPPSFALPKTQPNQFFTPSTPLPDLTATSHFLLLGEKGSPIATIKVTPQDEPVHVREMMVTLQAEISSFLALEISDEFGFVLGNATLDLAASSSRTVYTLTLNPENAYAIDRREDIIFVARPFTKDEDAGGVSGETAQVSSMTLSGTGLWTSRTNLVSTSGPDFQKHSTTNAVLHTIARNGKEKGTFTTGTQKAIGAFTFEARKNRDGDPELQSLIFSVSAPSEVTLSNVSIRGNDSDTSHSCSVASGTITCSSIPSSIGSLQSPRTITVYADVTLSGTHPDPFLQIELNQSGRPGSPGAITWTDGDTSFTWVPFNSPVAQGTLWK